MYMFVGWKSQYTLQCVCPLLSVCVENKAGGDEERQRPHSGRDCTEGTH